MPSIRFMVADGSPALQTFARQLFQSYGYPAADIKTVSTLHAALEAAAELVPDFLLTDAFPKESIDGISLHKQLRSLNPACRFGLLSTDTSAQFAERAQKAGAQFLLPKPCTAEQLRQALATAMGKASREPTSRAPAPPPPQFKPDDRVVYQGRMETVKYIIVRRGELVVQLNNVMGMVPASKLIKT